MNARPPLLFDRIATPLGPMLAVADDLGLCLLEFADRLRLESQLARLMRRFRRPITSGEHVWIEQIRRELAEYFAGVRTAFDTPLRCEGTDFQSAVWNALRGVAYGETISYQRLAREVGRPGASRAVGHANGVNRLAIVVPCHRVVRSDGGLAGYGGGLQRKRWLLEHERSDNGVRNPRPPGCMTAAARPNGRCLGSQDGFRHG